MSAENTTARERVLNIAEQLFLERGYLAVSMSDLAAASGMQKASLYHHASEGKEALFIEVMERILERHRAGLEAVVRSSQPTFNARLQAAAHWLLNAPSLHYERMMQSDIPALSPEHILRLNQAIYAALLKPLETVFEPEMLVRGVDVRKVSYLAGAFLSVIETVHRLPENYGSDSKADVASFLIEMLFKPFGMSGETGPFTR